MKVILRSNIEALGKIGEVVEVAPGHARNYLIPKDMAYPANKGNLKRIEFEKKKAHQLVEQETEAARKLAGQMKDISLTFQVKVGDEEQFYGSVSASDIASELAKQGHEIERRRVILDEPIKQLGVYTVLIKLHPEVQTEVKVWVVKE
ncbi:MAG: 50S ribosomal protein L9 [Candidatus Glassbacteria bacterium]|nr:50S ribosomal protein L9 [Candidatus Glassbacteria bacterium]